MRVEYEYTFLHATPSALETGDVADLERLGHSGWQIVGITAVGTGIVLVAFQRELGDRETFEEAAAKMHEEVALVAPLDDVEAIGREE